MDGLAQGIHQVAEVGRDVVEVGLLLQGDHDLLLTNGPGVDAAAKHVTDAGVGERLVPIHVLYAGGEEDAQVHGSRLELLGKPLSKTGAGTLIVTPPRVLTTFSNPLNPTST